MARQNLAEAQQPPGGYASRRSAPPATILGVAKSAPSLVLLAHTQPRARQVLVGAKEPQAYP